MIGLCGDGFPDVWHALRVALPDVGLISVPVDDCYAEKLPQLDVLVPLGASVSGDLMDATRPRLIQQFGVGLQGVDLTAARARGIPVAFVPAANTGNAPAVAEIAMLHLLALLRRYPDAVDSVGQRRVGQPIGSTLNGKTVSVLGVGAIGTAVITRLTAFGAVPVGIGRKSFKDYPSLTDTLDPENYYPNPSLTTALGRSHALVVCCPLTEDTRNLIGAEQLNALLPGGYVVNVGRGPVVNHQALCAALRSGHLSGAGLDVAWNEPIDLDDELLRYNVTVTPHIGGVTNESYQAMAEAFADNVRRLWAGELLEHRAD